MQGSNEGASIDRLIIAYRSVIALSHEGRSVYGIALSTSHRHRKGRHLSCGCSHRTRSLRRLDHPTRPESPSRVITRRCQYRIPPLRNHAWHVDRVKAIAEQCNLDVIVAMTTNGVASIFPLALRGLNTAFVFSEHNQPDFYVQQWWGIGKDFSAKMAMRDALINAANKVHVLRASCAPEELVAANKVHVIPNAVEPTQLRASPPVDHRPIKFISIGRLSPEKGLQDAILAFDTLKDKIPEWEYKIFGDGPLLSELEALTKDCVSQTESSSWGTHLPHFTALAESHLLLLPSKFEGWPLVAGEAQSVGLPILGFRDCDSLSEAFWSIIWCSTAQRSESTSARRRNASHCL